MPDIYINYGKNIQTMTMELMEAADIQSRLTVDSRVLIKPNLVVSRPAEGGATTHPEIIEGIIQYLQHNGIQNITVTEGSWVGDNTRLAFANCGYTALAKKYGVALHDTKGDRAVKHKSCGMELGICESIAAAEYIINVPVMKGHCQTNMTCCLKNLKGCIPDSEKRRYHSLGLHKPIAVLNTVIKPQLHIIDSICGDLTFEEGGNPIDSGRIMLGYNPVLLDSYCAGLMGYLPDDIGYLKYAREYGVGSYCDEMTEIVELNAGNRPKTAPSRSSKAKQFAKHIEEDSACSACYAALIFALSKTGANYQNGKIKIGQGYKGKTIEGIGVGNCTANCTSFVKGCPPTAIDIVEFLKKA